MDQKDSQKTIDFLSKKWRGRACPMCGAGQWSVQNNVFEIREFHGGNIVLGNTPIVPVIPVTCGNCGNTILINAITVGIVPLKKEEEKNA